MQEQVCFYSRIIFRRIENNIQVYNRYCLKLLHFYSFMKKVKIYLKGIKVLRYILFVLYLIYIICLNIFFYKSYIVQYFYIFQEKIQKDVFKKVIYSGRVMYDDLIIFLVFFLGRKMKNLKFVRILNIISLLYEKYLIRDGVEQR